LFSGTLPDGLSLTPSTGEISGTPTTIETQAGIVLEVSDFNMLTDQSNSFQITIDAFVISDVTYDIVNPISSPISLMAFDVVNPIANPVRGQAVFQDSFEFAGGWDETVGFIPEPVFVSPDHNEAFEFADSWDETVDGTPSPTFSSANFNEGFDGSWDGT